MVPRRFRVIIEEIFLISFKRMLQKKVAPLLNSCDSSPNQLLMKFGAPSSCNRRASEKGYREKGYREKGYREKGYREKGIARKGMTRELSGLVSIAMRKLVACALNLTEQVH